MEPVQTFDEDAVGFELDIGDLSELEELRVVLEASLASCSCSTLDLRVRTFANGSAHFVRQCLKCGRQKAGALSKEQARTALGEAVPTVFEEALNHEYSEARALVYAQVKRVDERIRELRGVDAFAEDPATLAERLRREQSVARLKDALTNLTEVFGVQGALRPASTEYVRFRQQAWQNSFEGFEGFTSEPQLREWLESWLGQDFDFFPEVPGRHPSGKGVQVDYLLYPKQHLVDQGFCQRYVCVEAKYLNQREGFSHRASRAMWQTISYTQSTFTLAGQELRPAFGLLFSNLSFEEERARLKVLSELYNDLAQWRALRQLANHAAVGIFEMRGTRSDHSGWKMDFAGGTYFSRKDNSYLRETTYRLSDRNTAEKVRTGNF